MQPYAKKKILVVDSDAVSLAVSAMLLEREGFDVKRAENCDCIGTGYLPFEWIPDIVIVDVQMSGLKAPEFADLICKRWPHARRIGISAIPDISITGYALTLCKPLSAENLHILLSSEPTTEKADKYLQEERGSQFDNEYIKITLDPDVFSKLEKRLPPLALEQLFRTMLSESWQHIPVIRAAIASSEINAVCSHAHYLSGSAVLTGASDLLRTAHHIDTTGASTHGLQQWANQLEEELNQLPQTLAGKFS